MKNLIIPESLLKEQFSDLIKERDALKPSTSEWAIYDLLIHKYRMLFNKAEDAQDTIDRTYLSAWKSCEKECGKEYPSDVTKSLNKNYLAYVESLKTQK